jgi:hypothetical protein
VVSHPSPAYEVSRNICTEAQTTNIVSVVSYLLIQLANTTPQLFQLSFARILARRKGVCTSELYSPDVHQSQLKRGTTKKVLATSGLGFNEILLTVKHCSGCGMTGRNIVGSTLLNKYRTYRGIVSSSRPPNYYTVTCFRPPATFPTHTPLLSSESTLLNLIDLQAC